MFFFIKFQRVSSCLWVFRKFRELIRIYFHLTRQNLAIYQSDQRSLCNTRYLDWKKCMLSQIYNQHNMYFIHDANKVCLKFRHNFSVISPVLNFLHSGWHILHKSGGNLGVLDKNPGCITPPTGFLAILVWNVVTFKHCSFVFNNLYSLYGLSSVSVDLTLVTFTVW